MQARKWLHACCHTPLHQRGQSLSAKENACEDTRDVCATGSPACCSRTCPLSLRKNMTREARCVTPRARSQTIKKRIRDIPDAFSTSQPNHCTCYLFITFAKNQSFILAPASNRTNNLHCSPFTISMCKGIILGFPSSMRAVSIELLTRFTAVKKQVLPSVRHLILHTSDNPCQRPGHVTLCGYVERQYKFALMFWSDVNQHVVEKCHFCGHHIKATHYLVVFRNVNRF